jgi:hypothetical protein
MNNCQCHLSRSVFPSFFVFLSDICNRLAMQFPSSFRLQNVSIGASLVDSSTHCFPSTRRTAKLHLEQDRMDLQTALGGNSTHSLDAGLPPNKELVALFSIVQKPFGWRPGLFSLTACTKAGGASCRHNPHIATCTGKCSRRH